MGGVQVARGALRGVVLALGAEGEGSGGGVGVGGVQATRVALRGCAQWERSEGYAGVGAWQACLAWEGEHARGCCCVLPAAQWR